MGEVLLPSPVPATRVPNDQSFFGEGDRPPGSFQIHLRDTRYWIIFSCPCGCSAVNDLPIYKAGEQKPAPNAWTWDGDEDRPTLSPSIHHLGHWHGFLQAGEFRQA